MKNKNILIFLLISTILCSCNNKMERIRMMTGLAGTYPINRTLTSRDFIKFLGKDNVKLVLIANGDFYISSNNPCINKLKGTWSLSEDLEISNFVFKIDGKEQIMRFLGIETTCSGTRNIMFFS